MLARRSLPIPSIRTVTTKGEHWYYLHPGPTVAIGNRGHRQGLAFDLRGDAMIVAMTERARCAQQPGDGQELQATQAELRDADRRIARLTSLIEETDTPGPLLRRIEELERGRDEAAQRLQRLEEETRRAKALATVKESDVRRLLDALSEDLAALDREHLKDFLAGMIEAISLDPDTRAGEIRYRIGASGVKVASPRGTVTNPILSASVPFHAPRNRRAA